MIYLILIIIFILPIILRHKVPFFEKSYWYWGECILLVLVAGLRLIVGGDTQTYMYDFDTYPTINEFTIFHLALFRYQPLWILLNSLAKTIYPEFFVLQLILSAIVNPVTFYIIKKETSKKYEVAFIYLLFQFLYLNCEIMRETFSICIFYFAFGYLIKHKWLPYYGLCFVAFLFHDAAAFYFILPLLLPILTKEFTPKYTIAIIFILLILTNPFILTKMLFFFPESRIEGFKEFYSKMAIGSVLGMLRSIIEIPFIYYIIRNIKRQVSYKVYIGLKLYFCLHLIGLFMPIFVNRVCNSYNLFYYIAWVEFLFVVRKKITTGVYCSLMIISFFRYYFVDVTNLVSAKESSDRYYFYELFVPYYSIFDTPDSNIVARRKAIYTNQIGDDN